jgi:hypothetical protein
MKRCHTTEAPNSSSQISFSKPRNDCHLDHTTVRPFDWFRESGSEDATIRKTRKAENNSITHDPEEWTARTTSSSCLLWTGGKSNSSVSQPEVNNSSNEGIRDVAGVVKFSPLMRRSASVSKSCKPASLLTRTWSTATFFNRWETAAGELRGEMLKHRKSARIMLMTTVNVVIASGYSQND